MQTESSKSALFDRIASNILIVVLGLSPIFFIPFLRFSVEVGKTYFIALGVIAMFVCWVIARMIQGSISLPKTPIITALVLLPIVFLISAFFSPAWNVSLGGLMLGSGTVIGITVLVLIFIGSALYINSERKIASLFRISLIVTAIITLFQIVYLIVGTKYLNLGTFYSNVSNVVGKWNDLAIWYGLVVIVIMMAFQFMSLARRTKIFAAIVGVFAMIFLVLANFPLIWAVLGLISLTLFIYAIMILRSSSEEHAYRFPFIPFIVLIISLFFFLANPFVGGSLVQKFGLSQTEIRPGIGSTAHVMLQTIKQRPIVGVGPDRFANAWYVHQPKSIILTRYASADFGTGFGFIPTLVITTGILGGITLLAFLILFLLAGIVHIGRKGSDLKTHFYIVSAFTTALYLWIMAIVYIPGVVGITFTFAVSGICIGILNMTGRIPTRQIHFLKDPRHSFFAIIVLVALLLGSFFVVFTGGEKFISLALYSRSQTLFAKNDLVGASNLLAKATTLYPADTYYRANSSVALTSLGKLLNNTSLSKDILKSEFQNIFTAGENSARQALIYDKTNPQNWINLATLYQNVMPLQIAGAYDNAKAALDQASKLAPNSPDIELLKARLAVANKDNEGAKTIIKAILARKPNFVSGIFFLAELEAANGDTATAISQLETAALADPRNAAIFLELGVFKYDNRDYDGAVSALERSITLDPTVLNTHYLLGLSYAKVGRTDDAKKIFAGIQKSLPENTTITKIVNNLSAGRDPLDGIKETNPPAPLPESADAPPAPTTKADAKTQTPTKTTKPTTN